MLLPLWYKNAIIYCLDVETFQDSNADGVGDFRGLLGRVKYLSGLGVTCIWLMPFYPTPNKDNGYDVKDYFNVDPRLGDLGDFVDFMHAAKECGIRVIIDLVVNHTSIEHPWFQQARSSPDSHYRNYYVWSEQKPDDAHEDLMFPGFVTTKWTFDESAGMYYYHRFYSHQAELNIANPAVRDEIRKILSFWLSLGISGFRVDATPSLIEPSVLDNPSVDEPEDYLVEFREYLSWYRGDAILLAEANIRYDEVSKYFGHGERLQMMFGFLINHYLMLSLAREKANAIGDAIQAIPRIPAGCQWANFLRNHDELAIDQLSASEQQEIYDAFAPEESMRIYDRGIRRRLPPMLNGNVRRLKLAQSLLFTLPGTPVLRYGEEIGMGEDLSLDQRNSIRTPMQWSDDHAAGFSTASIGDLVRPVIDYGDFRYENINVQDQERDPESLLSTTERMIRNRKEHPAFGWGETAIINTHNHHVLAHQCTTENETVIAVHNFSRDAQSVRLGTTSCAPSCLKEILADDQYEPLEHPNDAFEINGYGYRWFQCVSAR